LLDNEADVFEPDYDPSEERFLMQVFTYPIFDKDTFFLEVIQRRGARGFGVGNVTALARSVNAYKEMLQRQEMKEQMMSDFETTEVEQ
jgi:4-hydroxyphenylpyruvate dioxygenase-like putative hemolysin